MQNSNELIYWLQQHPDDDQKWREFIATYQPFIFNIARRSGLQFASAQDLGRVFKFKNGPETSNKRALSESDIQFYGY